MNIHRPANTNQLPAEAHSHDEVGFRKALEKHKNAAWSDAYEAKWNEWAAKFKPRDPNTIPDLPKPKKKLNDVQWDADNERFVGWTNDGVKDV